MSDVGASRLRRRRAARRPASRGPCRRRVDLNGIDFVEVDPADHTILRVSSSSRSPPARTGSSPSRPRRVTIVGRHAHRRDQGARRGDRVGSRAADRRRPPAATSRPTSLTLDAPDLDPVAPQHGVLVHGELPDRRRLPAGAVPAAGARRAAARLPGQGLRELPPPAARPAPTLNPDWIERNPSDLGIALLELLAYTGDRLSYFQDAVANEAYLDTAAHRISARRHARLIDYRMHDGRNAWAAVTSRSTRRARCRAGRRSSRDPAPLAGEDGAARPPDPGRRRSPSTARRDPALRDGRRLRDRARRQRSHRGNNEIRVHTWGDEECCLAGRARPRRTSTAVPDGTTASRPVLAGGRLPHASRRSSARGRAPPPTPTRRTASSSGIEERRRSTTDSALRATRSSRTALQVCAAPATRRCRCCASLAARRRARASRSASRRGSRDGDARAQRLGRARQHRPRRPRPHDRARRMHPGRRCTVDGRLQLVPRGPLTHGVRARAPVSMTATGALRRRPRTTSTGDVRDGAARGGAARHDAGRRRAVDAGAGPARQRPVRRALRRRGRRRRAAPSCASATASTARELARRHRVHAPSTGSATAAPATSARDTLPTRAPAVRRAPGSPRCATRSPATRRRRRRDDRGGPPARARRRSAPSTSARSPRPTGPRRRRGSPTSRRRGDASAGPAAGTRSSSPSTRSTAPTSSTCPNGRTRLEPALRARACARS